MKINKLAIVALAIFSGSFLLYFILSVSRAYLNETIKVKDKMALLTNEDGPTAIGISRDNTDSMLILGKLQDFTLFSQEEIPKNLLNNKCFYYLKHKHSIVYCKKDNIYYWLAYDQVLDRSHAIPMAKNHLRILLDVR